MFVNPRDKTVNVKVVYLAATLSVGRAQIDAATADANLGVGSVVTPLPPTDAGERTVTARLRWPEALRDGYTGWIYVFQAPTDLLSNFSRALILKGADVVVVAVDDQPEEPGKNDALLTELQLWLDGEQDPKTIVLQRIGDARVNIALKAATLVERRYPDAASLLVSSPVSELMTAVRPLFDS